MRIVHTESSVHMGGQELRILDQIQWLLNKGHSAWLLAREDSAIHEEAIRRGIPIHHIPFRGSAHPQALFEIVKFVKQKRIQLIDCHSSSDACTAIAAKLFGIPIVRTIHVYEFKTDLIHKHLLRYGTNHIIVVSQAIADMLVRFGFADQQKISVIPTGIDLNRFSPDVDGCSIRKELNIAENTKVISMIGMIRPGKGQKFFIRAIDRIAETHSDVLFLIVGSPTEPEYLKDINKDISALRHRNKVVLTGYRRDVEKVIAASDMIVNTCFCEPMSQVIHQSFAMQKLVVAGDSDGHLATVRHGETGFLFRSADAESFAKTVIPVLDDNVRKIRERAYQMALSELGINTMMEKTLNIYRTILKTKQPLLP
jgi:glycosyltransferase involved in cell wall biosynthesis